jgi:hypothetical protein
MTTISPHRRLIRAARRTEGRLALLLVATVVLAALAGISGAFGVAGRATLLDDAIDGGTLRALEVQHALADADTAIANAFLAGAPESSGLRVRYRADVATATAALTVAASADTGTGAVAELSTSLPVYVGQVEDAVLARNRPGLDRDTAHRLGANYLREPAVLARDSLHPAAQRLSRDATTRLAAVSDEAGAAPWFALITAILLVAGLVFGQVYLARATRRLFNLGLVPATGAALVALIWLCVVSAASTAHSEASRDALAQVTALTELRVAGLQARADEAMSLVARDNGAEYFDQRFDHTARRIDAELLPAAREAVSQSEIRATVEPVTESFQRWMARHRAIRALADPGRYFSATALAVDDRLAVEFDSALGQAINQAGDRLTDSVRQARGALSGAAAGLAVLLAFAAVSTAVGMWPRIAEYR